MKKQNIITLIIFLVLYFTIFLVNGNNVYALEKCECTTALCLKCIPTSEMQEIKLKKVFGFTKTSGYSVQSITTTDKYFLVIERKAESDNYLKVFDINTFELKKTLTIHVDHGNDMAFNPKTNEVIVAHAESTPYISIFDATTFELKEKKQVNFSSNADEDKNIVSSTSTSGIAYDKENDVYYFRNGSSIVVTDNKFVPIGKSDVRNFSAQSNLTGQGIGYHNGMIYRVEWEYGQPSTYQTYNDYNKNDNLVYILDVNEKNKTEKLKNILYIKAEDNVPEDKTSFEIESVTFIGDVPYFLFNENGTAEIYTIDPSTYKSASVSLSLSIKGNNDDVKKLGTQASLSGNGMNQTVENNNGKYTFKSFSIASPGKYTFVVKQLSDITNLDSFSNLKSYLIDTSNINAVVDVSYDAAFNRLLPTITYSKTAFTNGIEYREEVKSVEVIISNRDFDYSGELIGAMIQVLDEEGNIAVDSETEEKLEYTSSIDQKILHLDPGKYKIKVIKAPSALEECKKENSIANVCEYQLLNREFNFSIDEDGTINKEEADTKYFIINSNKITIYHNRNSILNIPNTGLNKSCIPIIIGIILTTMGIKIITKAKEEV